MNQVISLELCFITNESIEFIVTRLQRLIHISPYTIWISHEMEHENMSNATGNNTRPDPKQKNHMLNLFKQLN